MTSQAFLLFTLDGQRFAVDTSFVRETVWLPELTQVEEVPPWLIGLFNLRGKIINVIDLRLRFGHRARQYLSSDQVVVLQREQQLFGLVVSEVDDVVVIIPDIIQPLHLGSDTSSASKLIAGEVRVGDDLVAVLNLSRLMNIEAGQTPAGLRHMQETSGNNFYPEETTVEMRELFRQRAVALQNAATEDNFTPVSLAIVELSGEYFGIELEAVEEFCRTDKISQIPCCPSHILGAVSLRGELLTLVDPSSTFNLPPIANSTKAVVGRTGERMVALAVDEVHDAVYLHPNALQPPPALLREQYGSVITATAPYQDKMMTILDLPALLSREEWAVLDDA